MVSPLKRSSAPLSFYRRCVVTRWSNLFGPYGLITPSVGRVFVHSTDGVTPEFNQMVNAAFPEEWAVHDVDSGDESSLVCKYPGQVGRPGAPCCSVRPFIRIEPVTTVLAPTVQRQHAAPHWDMRLSFLDKISEDFERLA
jgi:hypothetical protein